ncbi:DUF397 domain-containing protein [Streptomyces sp. P17]|uniref:DUF397 domain-containing protein n=1 Tax=Streptomyces sp. P17 TaxID=3074716 RepID=UPI0028F45A2D|nr:DUF397 domain-containing protein [Streptomyces sp. P17]MDT9700789.1 DUF397 domain-containing protein [Streptomyces sp. P17]
MSSAVSGELDGPGWFTSSYSNGAGGECVECALSDDRARVRDSKTARGPVVTFTRGPWQSFIHAVEKDQFEISAGRDR